MKNNTKLIMEAWRKFLAEGPDAPMYDPEEGVPSGNPIDPSEERELSGDVPSVGEDQDLVDDIKKIDSESDKYGDPALMGRDSSAPMLDAPDDGDDYMSYDREEEEYYASRGGKPAPGEDTADETMPPSFDSGSFDDSMHDMEEEDLDYDSAEYYEDFPTGHMDD